MPLARVGARTESTTRYSYNARRGQLPRTRIGIVRRTRLEQDMQYAPRVCTLVLFIIKGNEFQEVENDLSNDARVGSKKMLHSFCQNGDHYIGLSKYRLFSTDPVFFIIFKDTYRVVSDLATAIKSKWDKYEKQEYELHKNCRGGLYYWSSKEYWSGNVLFYIMKQVTQWSFEYHVTEDLHTDKNGEDIKVSVRVLSNLFLVG